MNVIGLERSEEKTLNQHGRKPAWQEPWLSLQRECVCVWSSSDQSDPLLDTWKSYPMPLRWLISAMNYETNKSVAVGLWEFCAAYWEVISGSSFDKPAVCIPLPLRNMLMKTELKSTGVHLGFPNGRRKMLFYNSIWPHKVFYLLFNDDPLIL